MDLHEKLRENKRHLESGKINENEYSKRRKSLINEWSKKTKKGELIRAVNKPREMDLYEILNLKPNATKTEISSSYRKLAIKYHPDKNHGYEAEEWGKISKAYQILADDSSRFIYDYYGTIDNSLEDKASFNPYVGGELWQPYIGNLEIGFWSLSFINNELKILASTVQKKRRHDNRMSSIVRYLQDKLFRFPEFPEQDDSSQFEINLYEEAKKLSAEPNGKKLLFTLGKIYTDEAKTYLNKSSTVYSKYFSSLKERLEFFINFTLGYLMIRTKNNPDLEETNKLVWNLSKSEISSIVREACEKVLHDENRSEVESYHLANSMLLLGKTWLEVSEW